MKQSIIFFSIGPERTTGRGTPRPSSSYLSWEEREDDDVGFGGVRYRLDRKVSKYIYFLKGGGGVEGRGCVSERGSCVSGMIHSQGGVYKKKKK